MSNVALTGLSADQSRAYAAAVVWLRAPHRKQVFRLNGYAGTGKTTILQLIADAARRDTGRTPIFAAPTGKAAARLVRKGNVGARTIHSLLYYPPARDIDDTPRSTLAEHRTIWHRRGVDPVPKRWLGKVKPTHPFVISDSIVILDEASMVDSLTGTDLLATGASILVVGDDAQLPPVVGKPFFTDNTRYPIDAQLTTVHRQAGGSTVLARATDVRNGVGFNFQRKPDFRYSTNPSWFTLQELLAADQIICATNDQRHRINSLVRRSFGRKQIIEVGDKLVATANNSFTGVMNGTLWQVINLFEDGYMRGSVYVPVVKADLQSLDNPTDPIITVRCRDLFPNPNLPAKIEPDNVIGLPLGFTYGNAITVHKSQGSEWDNVLVIGGDQSGRPTDPPGTPENKWWYTALTRASKSVIASASWYPDFLPSNFGKNLPNAHLTRAPQHLEPLAPPLKLRDRLYLRALCRCVREHELPEHHHYDWLVREATYDMRAYVVMHLRREIVRFQDCL